MNKLSTIKKSKNNRIFFVDNEFDNILVFDMALEDKMDLLLAHLTILS